MGTGGYVRRVRADDPVVRSPIAVFAYVFIHSLADACGDAVVVVVVVVHLQDLCRI